MEKKDKVKKEKPSELELAQKQAHRMLKELSDHGYVRQLRSQGDYALTIRLAALGLGFLARTGVTDRAALRRLYRGLVRIAPTRGAREALAAVEAGE